MLKEFGQGRMINKNQWPPHSPDLNPLDYYFWSEVQNKVFEGRILEVWRSASAQGPLQRAIKQFRPRLLQVIKQKGGPIKHVFK